MYLHLFCTGTIGSSSWVVYQALEFRACIPCFFACGRQGSTPWSDNAESMQGMAAGDLAVYIHSF